MSIVQTLLMSIVQTLCHWALCDGLFWEHCTDIVDWYCCWVYFENIVQTLLTCLFWQTIFLPPLMSPRQSSYVTLQPNLHPPIRLLRYVLSNSPFNTYPEMSGITGNGWDNDKWVWTVWWMVPSKVFELVWWMVWWKSIWNGLVKGPVNSPVNGPVKGLVKPFYILFTVELVFQNIWIQYKHFYPSISIF